MKQLLKTILGLFQQRSFSIRKRRSRRKNFGKRTLKKKNSDVSIRRILQRYQEKNRDKTKKIIR